MTKQKLDIIIPCYNEESRIVKSLKEIKDFLPTLKFDTTVIVVNDGSTDKTLDLIQKFSWIKIISYSQNKGKGYALRKGVESSEADLIYLCDADLSTPISEINKFLSQIDNYDIVIGSRNLPDSDVKNVDDRKLLGQTGNKIINLLLKLNIKDTQCGFKLFRKNAKDLFLKCLNDRWGYDFEFLYLARKSNLKILEIPVKWTHVEGSKLKKVDYIKTLSELYFVIHNHNENFVRIEHFLSHTFILILGLFWDMSSFLILNSIFGIYIYTANIISMTIGFAHNFILNTLCNLQTKDKLIQRYISFTSIAIAGMIFSSVLIYVCYSLLDLPSTLSKFISLVIVFLFQFLLNSKLTYYEKSDNKSN